MEQNNGLKRNKQCDIHLVMCSLLTKSKYMKIRLLEESIDREVELVGKVLCTYRIQ